MKTIKIINPQTPYTGVLPGGLFPGRSLRIQGRVEDSPTRITVDLVTGASPEDDILLHLNPRFEQRQVVRNSYLWNQGKMVWGAEEVTGGQGFPLVPGQFFEILISVEESHLAIWLNGQHYADYKHRGAVSRVTHLNVRNVMLYVIQLEGEYKSNDNSQYRNIH